MKWYRRMYYELYRWGLKAHGKEDYPQFNAMLGLSIATYINIVSVTLCVAKGALGSVPVDRVPPPMWVVGIAVVMLAHYTFLVAGRSLKLIVEEFSTGEERHRRRSAVPAFSYIILSVLAFFGIGYLTLW
jgi:hypothetical protein